MHGAHSRNSRTTRRSIPKNPQPMEIMSEQDIQDLLRIINRKIPEPMTREEALSLAAQVIQDEPKYVPEADV